MKKTIFDHDAAKDLKRRIHLLQPDAKAQWGKMNAAQMINHLNDTLRAGLKELPVQPAKKSFLSSPIGKYLLIYVFPWPKGKAQTAPEFDAFKKGTKPGPFTEDKNKLLESIDRFRTLPEHYEFPEHGGFGKMSRKMWGSLMYKHIDYHLSQFGV